MVWTETPLDSRENWESWEAGESVGELESPFTPAHEQAGEASPSMPLEWGEAESPFVSTPFSGAATSGVGIGTRAEAVAELLAELFDPEMEQALGEVVQEASAIHAEHTAMYSGEAYGSGSDAERAVANYLQPLAEQTEALLEQFATLAGDREAGTVSEAELNQLLESFESTSLPHTESPAFESFFGAIRRAASRAISGAVNLAKKGITALGRIIPLGAILSRLKALVAPLLNRVLQQAIKRLPVALQPYAIQLKRRLLGFEVETEAGYGETETLSEWFDTLAEAPAVGEVGSLHHEWNVEVTQMLLGEERLGPEGLDSFEGLEQSSFLHAEPAETLEGPNEAAPSANELDAARIQVIHTLANLAENESAGPAFEQFLPALLPVLRIGIRIVGRDKVVIFLANFLAKMLKKYVGPQMARPLSQAIVDAGLRLITLEAPTAQEVHLAGPAAIAAVAEDTARRVLESGAETFEDPARLEAETMAAFNEAIARNFPPSLLRSDLDELEVPCGGRNAGAMWALRPRVYWYKKYTRVFEITLTPQMARSITTFGGVTLAAALRATYGTVKPIKAKVHLYEALPGSYLSRIAALEKRVPGMQPDGWRRFHPLTVQASSALLGEPGLGKDVDPKYTRDRHHIACGQRFYFLQLPPATGGHTGRSPASQAFLTLDGRPTRNEIRLSIFLSEPEAQAIATRARTGNTTAFVLALRAAFGAALRSLKSNPAARVRVLKEAESLAELETEDEGVAALIAGKVLEIVLSKLIDAALRLATDYARVKRDEFVRAVDDRRLGVTVILTVPAPGLSTILRGGIIGSVRSVGLLRTIVGTLSSGRLLPGVRTVPGLFRG